MMCNYIAQIDETMNKITGLAIDEIVELTQTINQNPRTLPLEVPHKQVDIITGLRRMKRSQLMVLTDCLDVELREKRSCDEYDQLSESIINHIM